MQRIVAILTGLILAICVVSLIPSNGESESEEDAFPAIDVNATGDGDRKQEEVPIKELQLVKHEIKRGEVASKIFSLKGLPPNEITKAAAGVFDFTKIAAGKKFTFRYEEGVDTPIEIQYNINSDETLSIAYKDERWIAERQQTVYDEKRSIRNFKVTSSFWVAAKNVGLPANAIMGIIDVLQYDLDFNTEIREGAEARLIVTELYKDGEFVKLASPEALEFVNSGKKLTAIRYKNKRGKTMYYDENGLSRKGVFLRSPLPFLRITSRFNPKRFHPIQKVIKPHNGTDFGAPTGTIVKAVADGTVVMARVNGGHGKFVKIRHNGTDYHTSYSHLSKILVRPNQYVKQGKVIGKVGTTGNSTGPHLHFQMWRGNRHVDAMKEKTPKTQRLPRSEMASFKSVRDNILAELRAGQ